MTNILFLIDYLENDMGGTEKQLVETLRRLDRSRFNPILVCLRNSPWLEENGSRLNVTVLNYRGLTRPSFFSAAKQLAGLMNEHKTDLVSVYFEDAIFLAWAASKKAKKRPALVCNRRDLGLGKGGGWHASISSFFRKFVLRRYDHILVNARAIETHLVNINGLSKNKITVVYNGLNLSADTMPPADTISNTPNAVRIVFTANFNPIKRHDVFLKALLKLREKAPNLLFHIHFLGQGDTQDISRSFCREHGLDHFVSFEGAVQNVAAWLGHADIGVLCSDKEGLSNAILEYMKYGLPVVASDTGGTPELVGEDNGFLFSPGDVDALASALETLIQSSDLRKKLGLASRQKVINLCSWDKNLSETSDVYEKISRASK